MFPCHFVWQCQANCQKYRSSSVDFSADQFSDIRFLIRADYFKNKKGNKNQGAMLNVGSRVWIGAAHLSGSRIFKNGNTVIQHMGTWRQPASWNLFSWPSNMEILLLGTKLQLLVFVVVRLHYVLEWSSTTAFLFWDKC